MAILRTGAKALFSLGDKALPKRPGPRILIYHQIGAGTGAQMDVTVADFEWQMDWLSTNRRVVSLDEAIVRWDEPGSENLVVLTFDDGFADLATTAMPSLVERGFPFVLYLATSIVGLDDWEGRGRPLEWVQVSDLLGSGLATIGAHTHNHVDLRALDEDSTRSELTHSNDVIEEKLGVAPRHFAYPWGYWSAAADKVVRDIYQSSVLGAPSIRSTRSFDPHQIHRYPIQLSDGRRWFNNRLHNGLLAEESVRRRLRGYRGP